MDFDLTEDQRLLKESVDRLIADQYSFAQRKAYAAEPAGWSAKMWAQYAEMGLLGLPFEETLGGFGGGPVETMIVMETFGRGLVLLGPGAGARLARNQRPLMTAVESLNTLLRLNGVSVSDVAPAVLAARRRL